jgi:hypothetical protein
VDRVKQWWTSYCFQGYPSFVLACKIKALKADLRVQNEEVFGNVERQEKYIYIKKKHFFCMNYEFLIIWKKRELCMMRRI